MNNQISKRKDFKKWGSQIGSRLLFISIHYTVFQLKLTKCDVKMPLPYISLALMRTGPRGYSACLLVKFSGYVDSRNFSIGPPSWDSMILQGVSHSCFPLSTNQNNVSLLSLQITFLHKIFWFPDPKSVYFLNWKTNFFSF